jgi:hypothetical protein
VLRLLVLVVLAFALGQLEAAPVPKGAPKLWKFPTQVGTKWVYTESGDRDAEVTESILKVEETPRARLVRIRYDSEWMKNGVNWGVLDVMTLWVDDEGLFETSGREHIKPTFCLLKFQCTVGDVWERINPNSGAFKGTSRVGAVEKIKVPAGEFECVRLETTMAIGQRVFWVRTDWYAAGIGLVKTTGYPEKQSVRVLKAFTLGKD